jgi:DNA polymerase-3 subunit epsilon
MTQKNDEKLNSIVFVDTETTGLNPLVDRVFEVGIIRVENGKIVSQFQTVINPGIELPEYCYKMTGVKKGEIRKAPKFIEVKDKVFSELKGALFVAHNAKFDYDFLDQEFTRVDLPFGPPSLCTVKLTRQLYPYFPRHDLDTVTRRLKITINKRHRAFDDAYALWDLFKIIQRKFSEEKLLHIVNGLIVPGKSTFRQTAKSQMGMLI